MSISFETLNIRPEIVKALREEGIVTPTSIQEKTIPLAKAGKDLIGISRTGSGKTACFGIPLLEKVQKGGGVQGLVLAPTRELADQIAKELMKWSKYNTLGITVAFGGVPIEPQERSIARSEIVVGTPGRILDLTKRRSLNLNKLTCFILDEADKMVEMGFIEDVEQIIQACPRKRQTLFFSATISSEIKNLTQKYMINPQEVLTVKYVDPSKLKQVYYDVQKNQKLSLLIHLLKKDTSGLVMVFCNTRGNTDFVEKNLSVNGIDAIAIHGGLSQNKRTRTMGLFNKAKVEVLVCTDVAARGLHVDNVSHIYNYDLPRDHKDYVHRIGRTARAGESGKVVNLLCDYDYDNFSKILKEYRDFKIERLEAPQLEKVKVVRMERPREQYQKGRPSFGRGRGEERDRFSRFARKNRYN